MRIEAAERVVARILAQAEEHGDGILAADGDGTLWAGDVGDDLMWGLVDRDAVLPAASMAIARDAAGLRADPRDGVRGLLLALHERMIAGHYDEERFCELNAWMAAGRTLDEARVLAREILDEANVTGRLQRELRAVIEAVRARGIEVFVVSASPRYAVEPAAALLGIDEDHVVAGEVASEAGLLLPRVLPPIPYGSGKVMRLRERIGARPILAAFGDNVFDGALLEAATVRVAVRPKPRLRMIARRIEGLVELEPSE